MILNDDFILFEKAIRLATTILFSIELQYERMQTNGSKDISIASQIKWIDFQFFIIALNRLEKVACLLKSIHIIKSKIKLAIKEFNKSIPDLKTIRNIIEHLEEYAKGSGNLNKNGEEEIISRHGIENHSILGSKWSWLEYKIDIDISFEASKKLYSTIIECKKIMQDKRQIKLFVFDRTNNFAETSFNVEFKREIDIEFNEKNLIDTKKLIIFNGINREKNPAYLFYFIGHYLGKKEKIIANYVVNEENEEEPIFSITSYSENFIPKIGIENKELLYFCKNEIQKISKNNRKEVHAEYIKKER